MDGNEEKGLGPAGLMELEDSVLLRTDLACI